MLRTKPADPADFLAYRASLEPAVVSEWPAPLDLVRLAGLDPNPPQFIAAPWLPAGYATLLAGHGGAGKSTIALTFVVCLAAGVPFFGVEVARRRVLYLACEDRENVLHWRLARICTLLGVDLATLREWLVVVDLVGSDSILWDRDPRTGYTVTPAYGTLETLVKRTGAQILVVDGIADTFGGNENARADVKRYVNALVALISPDEGAVLLLGHIDKPSTYRQAAAPGYSGSTAWHNSVRARWYLYPEMRGGENGERGEPTGDLLLELQKSNLGRTDATMRFGWDEARHLFVGRDVQKATAADRGHREAIEREGVLAALAGSTTPVPAATTGPRTAYHVLSECPGFPDSLRDGATGRRRLHRHLEHLVQAGKVERIEQRTPARRLIEVLRCAYAPMPKE